MKKQLPIIVLSGTLILIALVTIQNFSAMKTQSAQKAGEACPITQSPICGSDNTTYDNACIASKKGIGFQYQGACKEDVAPIAPAVEKIPNPIPNEESLPISGQALPRSAETYTGITYTNSQYHYTIVLPKKSYFRGIGAGSGSSHQLCITQIPPEQDAFECQAIVSWYTLKQIKNLPDSSTDYRDFPEGRISIVSNESLNSLPIQSMLDSVIMID